MGRERQGSPRKPPVECQKNISSLCFRNTLASTQPSDHRGLSTGSHGLICGYKAVVTVTTPMPSRHNDTIPDLKPPGNTAELLIKPSPQHSCYHRECRNYTSSPHAHVSMSAAPCYPVIRLCSEETMCSLTSSSPGQKDGQFRQYGRLLRPNPDTIHPKYCLVGCWCHQNSPRLHQPFSG